MDEGGVVFCMFEIERIEEGSSSTMLVNKNLQHMVYIIHLLISPPQKLDEVPIACAASFVIFVSDR